MADQSSRSRFTGEEILALLDEEEEDGMIENFDVGKYNYWLIDMFNFISASLLAQLHSYLHQANEV